MVTFKTIQKLTGKLTQKIRVLDAKEGMTSEDIKYVINMVLSSLDLKNLSDEDKEDIIDDMKMSNGSNSINSKTIRVKVIKIKAVTILSKEDDKI